MMLLQLLGENLAPIVIEEDNESPSQPEEEHIDMVNEEVKALKQEPRVIPAIPIQTVIPTTLYPTITITPEAQVIKLTSRPITTKSILVTKASGFSPITLRNNKGRCIGRDTKNSPPKLVKASKKVYQYHDA
nr:hypothetical protein [Tanacetum cinerariifolium]